MANIDIEDVGDKLIEILQAQLPNNLAAVDARKSTQLNPDAPLEYIFGDMEETPMIPCVIVAGHTTQTKTDDPGWRTQSYHMEIDALYDAEDVQKCSRIIRRYGTAIDDTLKSSSGNNSIPGYWQSIENIAQTLSDTMTKKDGGLFQVVRVEFDVMLFTD